MRTYSTMAAGAACKLLVTDQTFGGDTRVVATLPDRDAAATLSRSLNLVAGTLLTAAADPRFPEALTTLGVRRAQVVPEPGALSVSALAEHVVPNPGHGAAWRSSGVDAVFYLAETLIAVAGLDAGPARSVRAELASLLALADGPVIVATVSGDDDWDGYRTVRLVVTGWFTAATDEELEWLIDEDFGAGETSDSIAYAYEPLVRGTMGSGFSVSVDAEQATEWLSEHRPHLLPPSTDD